MTEIRTVADLVVHQPRAAEVLHRHGIDFCCGGRRTLDEACAAAGIAPDALLEEVAQAEPVDDVSWATARIPRLVKHIVTRYHRRLDTELPRLEALARKVAERHGESTDIDLDGIVRVFCALRDELEAHMVKEEQVLFPWLELGHGPRPDAPIRVMMAEHDDAGEALATLRKLCNDYRLPDGACRSWTALWLGLKGFEHEMHEHIHLENNVLFPRALSERW